MFILVNRARAADVKTVSMTNATVGPLTETTASALFSSLTAAEALYLNDIQGVEVTKKVTRELENMIKQKHIHTDRETQTQT
jgi:hypothetical protein